MFKFVVLFAAVAALASSASLRISTNELREIYEIVETGVHQLQADAETRLLDIEEGIQSYTDAVTARLVLAMQAINQEFHDQVEGIAEKSRNDEEAEEVDRCIQEATEQLEQLDADIIQQTVEQLVQESRQVFETAQQLVDEAVEELDRLGRAVDECDENKCADDLAEEIEALQNKVAGEIAEALDTAHSIVQGLEADATEFDLREYEEAIQNLVEQVARCSGEEEPRNEEDEEERRDEEDEEDRRDEEEDDRRDEDEEDRRDERGDDQDQWRDE